MATHNTVNESAPVLVGVRYEIVSGRSWRRIIPMGQAGVTGWVPVREFFRGDEVGDFYLTIGDLTNLWRPTTAC